MSTTKENSKDVKEITLYNFATIRNAEYINAEAIKKNLKFISFNEEEIKRILSESERKQLFDNLDFDFLNFEKIRALRNTNASKFEQYNGEEIEVINDEAYTTSKVVSSNEPTIQERINNLYDQIYNIYISQTDDFLKINNLLCGIDFENDTKVSLENKTSFIYKVWLCFTYNIRFKDNFKEKEIATNLLRYFHLQNNRHLIDDENKKDRWENLRILMNAQVVIPEELFPKNETFFYGKKDQIQKQYLPTDEFKETHTLKVQYLNKEINQNQDQYPLNLIQETIEDQERTLEFLRKKKKHIDTFKENFKLLSFLPYIATINFIGGKCFLLASIDYSHKDKKDFAIKDVLLEILGRKFLFANEPENKVLKEAGFDFYFELIDKDRKNLIEKPTGETAENINFKLEVDFVTGDFKSIKSQFVWKYKTDARCWYQCNSCLVLDDGVDYYGKAFEPSGYGIQMLGIAEYKKVVSTISRYIPAEVARIENLMSGEFREKVTTHEASTEITEFESNETDKENLNETTTNDRFQMQNEVAQILNEQKNNNTTANVGYSNEGFYSNLTSSFSTVHSKEQNNKQAVTQAKEITNKAVEKIVSKVKKERTVKVTEKFIDVNKYGFDNRGNKEHVSGVYRHINAVYRNRIQNYGNRLTYEFSIPEPAKIHKLGVKENDVDLSKFYIPKMPKSYSDIDIKDIPQLEKDFDVELEKIILPEENYPFQNLNEPKEVALFKENFVLESINIKGFWEAQKNQNNRHDGPHVFSKISTDGRLLIKLIENECQRVIYDKIDKKDWGEHESKPYEESFAHKISPPDFTFESNESKNRLIIQPTTCYYTLDILVTYRPSPNVLIEWQKKQYTILNNRFNELLKERRLEIQKLFSENESNKNSERPNFRQIEIETLKRNCLSYLMDEEDDGNVVRKFGTNLIKDRSSFETFRVELSHTLDEYTAFVRFLEQAFEWENMSYNFYPYFWGWKGEEGENWLKLYNEDSKDPLHKAFLRAGMARVIVTVRPGFEDAVNLYITTGKIWNGGSMPVYGSSLFVAIAEELKSSEDYTIDDEWETVLPTNLIAIQSSGVSIKQEGLPNLLEYGGLGEVEDRKARPKRRWFFGLF